MKSRSKRLEQRTALKGVLARVDHLAPVTFIVPLNGPLAVHLMAYAQAEGLKPETIIAEALRAHLGEL